VVLGALAPALPAAVVGAASGANTTAVFSGVDPATQQADVYLETLGGGFGDRASKDGKDAVQVHITNTSNLPVEAIEMEYPLLAESYGLVEDSGGAGTFRGGLGLHSTVRPLGHTYTFNGAGERCRHQPCAVFGGQPGRSGRYLLRDDSGQTVRLDDKLMGVRVTPSQSVVIEPLAPVVRQRSVTRPCSGRTRRVGNSLRLTSSSIMALCLRILLAPFSSRDEKSG
jgi:N-methylhydantoinase B